MGRPVYLSLMDLLNYYRNREFVRSCNRYHYVVIDSVDCTCVEQTPVDCNNIYVGNTARVCTRIFI